MITVSWYAELALRSRVSMSATGSVIVMAWWPSSPRFPGRDLRRGRWARGCAQVDLSPGARAPGCYRRQLPAGLRDAGQLAAMRQLPEADPAQAEPAVDSARPPAAGAPGIPAHLVLRLGLRLGDQALLRRYLVLHEREAEPPQQRAALGVVGRGRDDGHVHAALPVNLIGIDLVEHQLLDQAEGVIPAAVELPVGKAAEVTDPGQRDRQQPVAEFPHPVAAQRHVRADRHALAQLELRDRLPGPGNRRLLPGDDRQVPDRAVDELGVTRRLAHAHIDHDLGQAGHLHHVGVAELLAQRRRDLSPVALLQPGLSALRRSRARAAVAAGLAARGGRLPGLGGRHQMSFPFGRATRTFCRSGYATLTMPSRPLSLPAMTTTWSPFLIFMLGAFRVSVFFDALLLRAITAPPAPAR